ncbi:MAG: Xaa-Pro aminopeptidase [uncultured Cytophagales bacterium]|uniref:Xaa-Pro aminopeptidase n=1 Tax=uncultured Cytophagales bacterium TaxID=158755 RepID=A0A6J4HMH3_9SPHI|nr:MAG: Xaa-Pro aminopeptidase [uncultured Cytophagales bacterium]
MNPLTPVLRRLALCTLALLGLSAFAVRSEDPGDRLPAGFHKGRREALRQLLPPNSVAVVFAAPVRNRANDVDFEYHQDPDFYYLTGYAEPHAVLLLFSSPQQDAQGKTYNELLYVQPRNPQAEMWTGRRMGAAGARQTLGFDRVADNTAFDSLPLNFKGFDKILFPEFHNDVRDDKDDPADLYDLVRQFRQKTDYPADYDAQRYSLYDLLRKSGTGDGVNAAQTVSDYQSYYPSLQQDPLLRDFVQAADAKARAAVVARLPKSNLDGYTLPKFMNRLRETKTDAEMKLMRKAIGISAVAQREVMKAMHPGMSEREIQGIHEFVYRRYGSEYEGYPSIVGAGNNGCVLHYVENSRPRVDNNLVLMDIGAEYHGYTADVTRTVPANGKFNQEQRAIYDLVYRAQEAGIAACREGADFGDPHEAAADVINKGLVQLGIIKDVQEKHLYFPHGTSHYLGLDVHDRGTYGPLKANSVITVEPGVYIPEGSPCDKKWWGIAVRIEDDILITPGGPENLSAGAPRKADDIEKLMAEKSVLNDWQLPKVE